MAAVDQQKAFLEAIADDTEPIVFCHSGLSHSVYLTQVMQLAPFKFKGREEPVFQLRMVEALAAASGVSAEEQFLLDCANDTEPLEYMDRLGERHYTILTRLAKIAPYKFKGRIEPVWQLTLVDARAVFEVQGAEAARAQTATAVSLYDHIVAKWDEFNWDFAQWE